MPRKTTYKKPYRKYKRRIPLKKYVRREIYKTVETKKITYTAWTGSSSFGYGSSSSVGAFFGAISQGAADGSRIGQSIFARGIHVRLAIQPGDNTNYVRCILVQAKRRMAPSVLPSAGIGTFVQSVLSNTASGATQYLAPVDTERYKVLYDKCIWTRYGALDGNSGSTIPHKIAMINKFCKLNRTMTWDDGGTMNDDVFLIMLSDSAAIAHPGVVAGFVRCYYKDA